MSARDYGGLLQHALDRIEGTPAGLAAFLRSLDSGYTGADVDIEFIPSTVPEEFRDGYREDVITAAELERDGIPSRLFEARLVEYWIAGECLPTYATQDHIASYFESEDDETSSDFWAVEPRDRLARRLVRESHQDVLKVISDSGLALPSKLRSWALQWVDDIKGDVGPLPDSVARRILRYFDYSVPPSVDSVEGCDWLLLNSKERSRLQYYKDKLQNQKNMERATKAELGEKLRRQEEIIDKISAALVASDKKLEENLKAYADLEDEALRLLVQEDGTAEDGSSPAFREIWTGGAAVLIGTSAYAHMPEVPLVGNNIDALQTALTRQLGMPSSNVYKVPNPEEIGDVLEVVDQASKQVDPARGGLFIYYGGHGWTDSYGNLHLGLTKSIKSKSWTSLRYAALRELVVEAPVAVRLVILDACYSGAALPFLSDDEEDGSAMAIEGAYVMASSDRDQRSLANGDEEYTPFTGEILKTFLMGIPQGPGEITVSDLFKHVKGKCAARGWPVPVRQILCDGDRISLLRNPWRKA
ncbi:caspase family protein [Streptomyces sp. NBC_00056]|uniref:caspase, EACC1-associated type n=1 Tax=Streptomyces sp. NBC_00056 TaxID=2975633 RepID=UPI003247226E